MNAPEAVICNQYLLLASPQNKISADYFSRHPQQYASPPPSIPQVSANKLREEVTHSQVLERPGLRDVAQRLLQALLFSLNLGNRLLGGLDSLALERVHRLVPLGHVVVDRLELPQDLFGSLDGRLVLEGGLVVLEVDLGRAGLQGGVLVQSGRVTSAESLELGGGLFAETKTGVDLGPVLDISVLRWMIRYEAV